MARAERTEELVLLPPRLDLLPEPALNRDLYLWLTAFLAQARPPDSAADPLRAGPRPPARGAPGDDPRCSPCSRACARCTGASPPRSWSSGRSAGCRRWSGGSRASPKASWAHPSPIPSSGPWWWKAPMRATCAARGSYKPLLPVPLWGEVRPGLRRTAAEADEDDEPGLAAERGPLGPAPPRQAPRARGARRARGPDADQQGRAPAARHRHGQRQPARRRGGSGRGAARGRGHGRAGAGQPRPQELEPPQAPARHRHGGGRRCARSGRSSPTPSGTTGAGPTSRTIARCSPAPRPRRARAGSRTRRRGARSGACGASSRRCGRGARRCAPSSTAMSSTPTPWSAPASTSWPGAVRQRRGLPRGAQPRARPRGRDPRRRVALDRQLARGPARARRREAGAHRARLGHRRLRRPVGDPGLHLAPPRGPGRACSRASTSP